MFEAHFQTFEDPEAGVALTARLSAFREELARRKLTGFVIPRADQQQNEYVAPSEERLAWLTGFTGSAGMAIVLAKEAAVFVDGRYTLQAGKQVDKKAWHVEPLADPPPEHWLARHLALPMASLHLGVDLRTVRPIDAIDKLWPRPVMIVHATGDEIIPFDAGMRLYQQATQPKESLWVKGGSHNGLLENPQVLKAVEQFVKEAAAEPVI